MRRSLTASKKVFCVDMVAAVVEKGDCLGIGEVIDEGAGRRRNEVEAVGAAQGLLYPPTPRLAILFSICAIASVESGELDPSPSASSCIGNCERKTSRGTRRARNAPTSRPTKRDFAATAMT